MAIAVLVLAVAGCGGPKLYPVKGRITLEGKPMKGGGAITFMPVSDQTAKLASGTIDENGNYELMTEKPGDGSMPGEFRVVINQTVEEEGEGGSDESKRVEKASLVVPEADRIPQIYGDAYESPLRATVEAKDLNEFNFDLKRRVVDPSRPPGAMRNLDFSRTYASR
jgi:hypothetical protein